MSDPRREQVEAIIFNYEQDVGSLRNWKGIGELRDAAALIREKALDAICALFPPPRTAPDREALVAALGIDKTTVRMNIDVHQLLDVCETWASTG